LALLCLNLAMKWFHLLIEKSRILKYILENEQGFQNEKFVLFKDWSDFYDSRIKI
jgi:hypothetical protein